MFSQTCPHAHAPSPHGFPFVFFLFFFFEIFFSPTRGFGPFFTSELSKKGEPRVLGGEDLHHAGAGPLGGPLGAPPIDGLACGAIHNFVGNVDFVFDFGGVAERGVDGREVDVERVVGIPAFDPLAALQRDIVAALHRMVGPPRRLPIELTHEVCGLVIDTSGLVCVAAGQNLLAVRRFISDVDFLAIAVRGVMLRFISGVQGRWRPKGQVECVG